MTQLSGVIRSLNWRVVRRFKVWFPSLHVSSYGELLPWQCSVSIHPGFEVLILLLDLLKALIQLHIFLFLERKKKINRMVEWFSSAACLDAQQSSAPGLTSLSISISFFSCWWSCLFLISSTTLRLSSSCSRYRVWESFCRDKEVVSRCSGTVRAFTNEYSQTCKCHVAINPEPHNRGRHTSLTKY